MRFVTKAAQRIRTLSKTNGKPKLCNQQRTNTTTSKLYNHYSANTTRRIIGNELLQTCTKNMNLVDARVHQQSMITDDEDDDGT